MQKDGNGIDVTGVIVRLFNGTPLDKTKRHRRRPGPGEVADQEGLTPSHLLATMTGLSISRRVRHPRSSRDRCLNHLGTWTGKVGWNVHWRGR